MYVILIGFEHIYTHILETISFTKKKKKQEK